MVELTGNRGRGSIFAASWLAAALAATSMFAGTTPVGAANEVIHISSTQNASIKIAKGKPRTI